MSEERDAQGRFTNGGKAGPGRSPTWASLIKRALNSDRREAIVQSAIDKACAGDAAARVWLIEVLEETNHRNKQQKNFTIEDLLQNASAEEAKEIARRCIEHSCGL